MRIEKVESIPYGIPVKGFADAYTSFTHSNAVLIKLYTDDGVIGLGEACAWEPEFYGESYESIHAMIMKEGSRKTISKILKSQLRLVYNKWKKEKRGGMNKLKIFRASINI